MTIIGGASTARQAIASGLVDQVEIGIVPVIFGEGLRLFETGDEVQLEKIEVLESPGRTDIKFRVIK